MEVFEGRAVIETILGTTSLLRNAIDSRRTPVENPSKVDSHGVSLRGKVILLPPSQGFEQLTHNDAKAEEHFFTTQKSLSHKIFPSIRDDIKSTRLSNAEEFEQEDVTNWVTAPFTDG